MPTWYIVFHYTCNCLWYKWLTCRNSYYLDNEQFQTFSASSMASFSSCFLTDSMPSCDLGNPLGCKPAPLNLFSLVKFANIVVRSVRASPWSVANSSSTRLKSSSTLLVLKHWKSVLLCSSTSIFNHLWQLFFIDVTKST